MMPYARPLFLQRGRLRRLSGVAIALGVIALAAVASLMLGAKSIPPQTVWLSLTGQLANADSTIILNARLPRTLAGIIVGMALGAPAR